MASHLLFEYDLRPVTLQPVDQVNSWQVETEQGKFFLKKMDIDRNQVNEIGRRLIVLIQSGITCILPFQINKYGDNHIYTGEGIYVLLPWIEKAYDIHELKRWEMRVIKQLATLHKASLTHLGASMGEEKSILSKVEERWRNRVLEFRTFHLQNHTRLSALLEDGKKKALRMGDLAIHRLEEIKKVMEQEGKVRLSLCHGQINRKNIIVDSERKVIFTHLEKATIDTPVKDLAIFFRRYAPYKNWDPEIGAEWLKVYTEIFPLTHTEKLLLGSYLLFPERVIRDVLHHGKTSLFQQKGYYQWQKRIEELAVTERFVRTITSHPGL